MSCKSRIHELFFGNGKTAAQKLVEDVSSFVGKDVSGWFPHTTKLLKDFSQKATDFIRAKVPWIPIGQHGGDISRVLTDEELPAFRQLMNRIAKHFAEDGEYTRYIDPGEMAIYFRDDPEFFKQGYVNALMDTTEHHTSGYNIASHIKPLDSAAAADRRAKWHSFIDELKQGLIDTFGEIRGKQLAEELGLDAAEAASDINKIICKWGRTMWAKVYNSAKASGATDSEATALAKIAATSHINIADGVVSGAYKNQWAMKKGVLGWIGRHPLYTIVLGVGGIGYLTRMIPWYVMDNVPFHVWMGREAGVIEKTFGDKEDEIVGMLETLSYQLRDNPCNTTVQTNFVKLLSLLKELDSIARASDPVPTEQLPFFKELYSVVYGTSIGTPNEYMRDKVEIDYSTMYTEYVLCVTEAGCTDPIAPPDGWNGVSGTGSIHCISNKVCLVWLDDLYIGTCFHGGLVIAGVEPGTSTVKMTYGSEPDCVKTVSVSSGSPSKVDCQFEAECPSVTDVSIYLDPLSPEEDETVSFNGDADSDDPIPADGWEWDFGDGSLNKVGQAVTHRYRSDGIYTVRLTVTNECGSSSYTTRNVTVSEEEEPVESTTLQIETPIDEDGNEIDRYWDVEIWVDGKYTSCDPPHTLTFGTGVHCDCESPWDLVDCELGTHTITMKKVGYDDKTISVYLEKDKPKTWHSPVMVKSTTAPTEHTVSFVVPVGSTLWVDGNSVTTEVSRITSIIRNMRK